jgi:hydroxyacylglutathione hydrolase
MAQLRVVVVPVLSDNYAYLLIDDATKKAAAVDPAEAALVVAAARREGVELVSVLTTHHHSDHAGGNAAMAEQVPGIKIYGSTIDNVLACTDKLEHDDAVAVGGIQVTALLTPGHTRGSLSFYATAGTPSATSPGVVFTGDTMFVGGCGRIFECTAEDLYRSISVVIGSLPGDTQVYVGHDYTVKNLEFAVAVEPGGSTEKLDQMLQWAKDQKLARAYSVPSTLQNEWLINPYLRASDPKMASICPGCSPVEVFAKLRKQKDNF